MTIRSRSIATISLPISLMGAVLGLAAPASADLILIQSDVPSSASQLGAYTGSLNWNYTGGNAGVLTVSLTHTSTFGGFLTAFLFNINSVDLGAAAALASTSDPDFLNISGGGLNGAPFGTFDAGAGLSGVFQGGGGPSPGLAFGQTGTFQFNVVASDASVLSASSFITGPNAFDFIVRFRGFQNGGSDKVPAIVVVPGPGALALLGLAGLVGGGRRRR